MPPPNQMAPLNDEQKQLVKDNIRWAKAYADKVSFKMNAPAFLRSDIHQEACLGMMRAAISFDSKQANFTTYSLWWMRSFVQRFLDRRQSHRFAIQKSYVSKATPEEKYSKFLESFDMEAVFVDGETTLHDVVADPNNVDIEKTLLTQEQYQILKGILYKHARAMVAEKQRKIALLILNYRMFREDPMTSKQLGDILGMSRQRISQVQNILINSARSEIEQKIGRKVNWTGVFLESGRFKSE